MKPVQKFEPVGKKTVAMVAKAVGPIAAMITGLGNVNLSAGAGVIDNNTKCFWDNDGHRIEVFLLGDGGFGTSRSKTPDPDCPAAQEAAE